jgi:hypothetical protein
MESKMKSSDDDEEKKNLPAVLDGSMMPKTALRARTNSIAVGSFRAKSSRFRMTLSG